MCSSKINIITSSDMLFLLPTHFLNMCARDTYCSWGCKTNFEYDINATKKVQSWALQILNNIVTIHYLIIYLILRATSKYK